MGKQDPFISQDPSQVTNVNPYTGQVMGDLGAQATNLQNLLTQGQGQGASLINRALGTQFDPTAAGRQFMGQVPGLQQVARSTFDPFASQQQADRLSQQAVRNISSQFAGAGPGALRSGAAASAISEGAINPLIAQNVRMAELTGGLGGQLLGQAQGLTQRGQEFGTQTGLQGLGQAANIFGGQQNILGSLMGQNIGARTALGANEFFNPQVANPGYDPLTGKDILGGALGLGGSFLGSGFFG